MSWLARSLASSLRLSPFEEEQEPTATSNREPNTESESESESDNSNRTVQEDLSDLTQTLSRQFWGVASLLSTQNANPGSSTSDDHAEIAGSPRIDGIKSDFAEIGNQFKSSISLFSNAKVVTEVSKMATSLLQFGSEEEDIDEEVVVFVKNLLMHPKTWLDFPEFDAGDSELSEAQEEHILAINHHVPELTDLKNELCPSRMTEGRFWTIYFLLIFPRLDKDKGELLSSPQIMKAREMLLDISHAKPSNQPEKPERKLSDAVVPTVREPSTEEKVILPIHTEENLTHVSEAQIIDKTVTEEELTADKSASWFEEEIDETAPGTGRMDTGQVGQVEVDVSFSDLEEEDDDDFVLKKKEPVTNNGCNGNGNGTGTGSSPESSKSSDWLQVDDIVVD